MNIRCSEAEREETLNSGWKRIVSVARGSLVVKGGSASMVYDALGGGCVLLLGGTVPKTTIPVPAEEGQSLTHKLIYGVSIPLNTNDSEDPGVVVL